MSTELPFIQKVYQMVSDERKEIHWAIDGTHFIIPVPEEFAMAILPQEFKHTNFASFVRQLNMYGFHKVADLTKISANGSARAWAFEHPFFQRGQPQLLEKIHRKPKNNQGQKKAMSPVPNIKTPPALPSMALEEAQGRPRPLTPSPTEEQRKKAKVLIEELLSTKDQQAQVVEQLKEVQKEQKVLWQEYAATTKKLEEQQTLNRQIIGFLAAIFKNQQAPSIPLPSEPAFASLSSGSITELKEDESFSPRSEPDDLDKFLPSPPSEKAEDFSGNILEEFGLVPGFSPSYRPDMDSLFDEPTVTPHCSSDDELAKMGFTTFNWVPS